MSRANAVLKLLSDPQSLPPVVAAAPASALKCPPADPAETDGEVAAAEEEEAAQEVRDAVIRTGMY